MQSLCKGSKFDYELYNQTETRDIFINGFQSCIAHGIESLMNDSKCISSTNWQHLITECPVPLELYHATDDPVVLLNHVKAVLEGYDHIPLTIIEGGQMILYKFPEKLLENM